MNRELARARVLRIIGRGFCPVGENMTETKIEPMVVAANVVQSVLAGDLATGKIREVAAVLPGLTFGEALGLMNETHVLVGDTKIGILCVPEGDKLKHARKLRKLPKAGSKRAKVLDLLSKSTLTTEYVHESGLKKAAEKLLEKGLVFHDSVDGYSLTKAGKKALQL